MKEKDFVIDKKGESDEDFAYRLGVAIEKKKAEFRGIRIMNTKNYERFQEIFSYLFKLSEGNVEYLDFEPSSVHADVSVIVPILDLYTEEMRNEFAEMIKKIDVFGITAKTDGSLIIDASVNYLWEEYPIEPRKKN